MTSNSLHSASRAAPERSTSAMALAQPEVRLVSRSSSVDADANTSEGAALSTDEADRLLYEMTDPLNRYYRYPVARALLPIFMRLPFAQRGITAMHVALGVCAGGLIARGSPRTLVAAFVLAEARMIFDCLDGVVARAKKLTTPEDATVDELGDTIGYTALQLGALVYVHRTWPEENLVFLLAAGLLVPGWMGMTYDYYRRTFSSFLRGTNDGPAEDLVRRSVRHGREGGGMLARFALTFEWLQTALLTPLAIPELLERIRRERDERGQAAEADPTLEATARNVRRQAHTPAFRKLLRFTSLVSGDNAISLFNFGLLTFAVARVEKLMIGFGFGTFVLVAAVCATWLGRMRPSATEAVRADGPRAAG